MKLRHPLLALCAAVCAFAAHAHPMLDHADPKVGSSVSVAPSEVRMWFTEELKPGSSTAHVTDASGRRVDLGRTQLDARDPMLLHVPVEKLAPGRYTATWRAVSVDTHAGEGRFTFRVAD